MWSLWLIFKREKKFTDYFFCVVVNVVGDYDHATYGQISFTAGS
jgi:hypothetical protein